MAGFLLAPRPAAPCSFRRILRRAYEGFYLIAVVFGMIELMDDILIEAEPLATWLREDAFWPASFAVGTLIFLSRRTPKERTSPICLSDAELIATTAGGQTHNS